MFPSHDREKSYCDRQSHTNSLEYLGQERYKKVNQLKKHNLENFILRYGEEKGKEKLEEYWRNINNKNYSKISQELFWSIHKYLSDSEKDHSYFAELNHEYVLVTIDRTYLYDFVCTELKFVIEFHGDHYHGNPKVYRPEDKLRGRGVTNILSKDVWNKDLIKEQLIREHRNYNMITVWESDYKKDKEKIVSSLKEKIDGFRLLK